MTHRDGYDGTLGTHDDDLFDNLVELDDVSYVGRTAFGALVRFVGETPAPSNTMNAFSMNSARSGLQRRTTTSR